MKNRQRPNPRETGVKRGRYVKNRLMIGDSRPNFMTKLDARGYGGSLNKAGATWGNFVMDQTSKGTKSFGLVDGSEFKRDLRIRDPRAAEIYGSKKKARKKSYKKDIYGNRVEGSNYKSRSKKPEKTFPSLPSFYGS